MKNMFQFLSAKCQSVVRLHAMSIVSSVRRMDDATQEIFVHFRLNEFYLQTHTRAHTMDLDALRIYARAKCGFKLIDMWLCAVRCVGAYSERCVPVHRWRRRRRWWYSTQ